MALNGGDEKTNTDAIGQMMIWNYKKKYDIYQSQIEHFWQFLYEQFQYYTLEREKKLNKHKYLHALGGFNPLMGMSITASK